MYKVMIVEDEPPISRMVKTSLEKNAPDFTVAKCCINGKSAIEELKKEDYDVIITDIRMPVMTGLELAQWIKENKPDTTVIILSGYSDFEYARKALEYKVFDYLLKPVSGDKIKELTGRIRTELGNRPKPKENKDECETVVILACAGAYLLFGAEVMVPGETFWSDEKIEKIMGRLLNNDEEYLYFTNNYPSERLIVIESETTQRQEEIAAELYNSLNKYNMPITLLYKKGVRFKDAGKTFMKLRDQLVRRLILNKSQLICCNDTVESYENVEPPYSKHDIDVITAAIKNGDADEVRNRLNDVFDMMAEAAATQEEVVSFLNIILDTYALYYPKKIQRKNSSVKQEFINAAAAFTDRRAFADDIVSILMTLKSDKQNVDRYVQLADNVEAYIIKNYNKNITNDVLAREFGFVPSYISRIFKRQKGLSPNEYITRYRIDTAKRMMVENPEMRIKEIAAEIGYRESNYFSKIFKKETGVWPTEYSSSK